MRRKPNIDISKDFQLLSYFMHLFLKHLCDEYFEEFTVKGSFSQYIQTKTMIRPITDIDLSVINLNEGYNYIKDLMKIKDEYSTQYKILCEEHLSGETLRMFIECKNNSARKTIQIDLNDTIALETDIKSLIIPNSDFSFLLQTYSLEEHIARKICGSVYECMLEFIEGHTFRRCRDLFDLYNILKYEFDREKLKRFLKILINENNIDLELLCKTLNEEEFILKNIKRYAYESNKRQFEFIAFEDITSKVSEDISLILKR